MKDVLILHGTNADSSHNWFPWLKKALEDKGYKVWVPDLPDADQPNVKKYNSFLLSSNFNFNDSIIIGHSSGSVEILSLLQHLPDDVKADSCYLIGSFKDNLGRDDLTDLFLEDFDFEKIKKKANSFIFIHSDNDPFCPLSHAEYLSTKTEGNLVIVKGESHFCISAGGEKYKQFPFLFNLVLKNNS